MKPFSAFLPFIGLLLGMVGAIWTLVSNLLVLWGVGLGVAVGGPTPEVDKALVMGLAGLLFALTAGVGAALSVWRPALAGWAMLVSVAFILGLGIEIFRIIDEDKLVDLSLAVPLYVVPAVLIFGGAVVAFAVRYAWKGLVIPACFLITAVPLVTLTMFKETLQRATSTSGWEVYETIDPAYKTMGFQQVFVDGDGGVWVSSYQGLYLYHPELGKFGLIGERKGEQAPSILGPDGQGCIWVSHYTGGGAPLIEVFCDGRFSRVVSTEGIRSDGESFLGLLLDRSSRLFLLSWAGGIGASGRIHLQIFERDRWATFDTPIAYPYFRGLNAVVDEGGNLWVHSPHTPDAVFIFAGNSWTSRPIPFYLSGFLRDRAGKVWIHGSVNQEAKLIRFQNGEFAAANYVFPSGFYPLAIDEQERVWGGGPGLVIAQGDNAIVYDRTNSGLPRNGLAEVAVDPGGRAWIVTSAGELVSFDYKNVLPVAKGSRVTYSAVGAVTPTPTPRAAPSPTPTPEPTPTPGPLSPPPPGVNAAPDPSFELIPLHSLEGWLVKQVGEGVVTSIDTGISRSGLRSLKVMATKPAPEATTQEAGKILGYSGWPGVITARAIAIEADKRYQLTVWVFTPLETAPGIPHVRVHFYDLEGKPHRIGSIGPGCSPTPGRWVRCHLALPPLAAFRDYDGRVGSVRLELGLNLSDEAAGYVAGTPKTIYFDDVFFGVIDTNLAP